MMMKYLYAPALICALFFMPAAAVGGSWKDGAYLRWYPNDDSSLSIEPLKQFATGFKPPAERTHTGKEWFRSCRDTSNQYGGDVAQVLRQRTIDEEYKLYVSLIILKLYNCQYDIYGLSERFDDKPQNLEELNLVHGAYVKLLAQARFSVEYPLAYNVVNYLKDSPALLKNKYIQTELRQTCKLAKERRDKHNRSACMKLLR
jgi:hypothetical protein